MLDLRAVQRFANDEISFAVPTDWVDQSMVRYVFPESEASVALTQRSGARGMPLDAYLVALLVDLERRLPDLRILSRRVEADAWIDARVEWLDDGKRQRAILRCVLVDDSVWTLSARAPAESGDEVLAKLLDRTITSLRAKTSG